MSEEAIQKELKRLGRKVRNTRLGLVIGFAGLGVGTYYGLRHLGEQHHQVFSEMYRNHRRPLDSRPWTERAREQLPEMPTVNFPPRRPVFNPPKPKPSEEGCPLGPPPTAPPVVETVETTMPTVTEVTKSIEPPVEPPVVTPKTSYSWWGWLTGENAKK